VKHLDYIIANIYSCKSFDQLRSSVDWLGDLSEKRIIGHQNLITCLRLVDVRRKAIGRGIDHDVLH
jgi:hypothetical protein